MTTVLVTACGCPGGPSLVRGLRGDFRVVGTDLDPAAAGRFHADAFYPTPPGHDPAFIDTLRDICRREGVDAVLPESSHEVLALARARGHFEDDGVTVLVSEEAAVRAALDKAETYRLVEGADVPLPCYHLIKERADGVVAFNDLCNAVYELGYPGRPVVLKRPDGKGGRGIWIVQDEVDRISLDMRRWPNAQRVTLPEVTQWCAGQMAAGRLLGRWLVMEYLEGDESSADTFDGYGTVLGFTKIRRDCRNGVHWRHEARYDPDLARWARRVVERLGLEYFVNVQFMAGKLLEVNPRISTMIYHEGYNLPALGVKLALGLVTEEETALPDGVRAQYHLDLRSYGGPERGACDGCEQGAGCGDGCRFCGG